MDITELGRLLPIAGSAVFLFGAALGVPRVFMTRDREERVGLLTANATRWRVAQVPYGVGPLLAAAGIVSGATTFEGSARAAWMLAGVTMLVGATCWAYSCWLRAVDSVKFARGEQPGWPFRTYVVLTLAGLASLGAALLAIDAAAWLGWLVLLADLGYVILYVATNDIPPYLFYVLLLVVGAAL